MIGRAADLIEGGRAPSRHWKKKPVALDVQPVFGFRGIKKPDLARAQGLRSERQNRFVQEPCDNSGRMPWAKKWLV